MWARYVVFHLSIYKQINIIVLKKMRFRVRVQPFKMKTKNLKRGNSIIIY